MTDLGDADPSDAQRQPRRILRTEEGIAPWRRSSTRDPFYIAETYQFDRIKGDCRTMAMQVKHFQGQDGMPWQKANSFTYYLFQPAFVALSVLESRIRRSGGGLRIGGCYGLRR